MTKSPPLTAGTVSFRKRECFAATLNVTGAGTWRRQGQVRGSHGSTENRQYGNVRPTGLTEVFLRRDNAARIQTQPKRGIYKHFDGRGHGRWPGWTRSGGLTSDGRVTGVSFNPSGSTRKMYFRARPIPARRTSFPGLWAHLYPEDGCTPRHDQ